MSFTNANAFVNATAFANATAFVHADPYGTTSYAPHSTLADFFYRYINDSYYIRPFLVWAAKESYVLCSTE